MLVLQEVVCDAMAAPSTAGGRRVFNLVARLAITTYACATSGGVGRSVFRHFSTHAWVSHRRGLWFDPSTAHHPFPAIFSLTPPDVARARNGASGIVG